MKAVAVVNKSAIFCLSIVFLDESINDEISLRMQFHAPVIALGTKGSSQGLFKLALKPQYFNL